MMKTWHVVSVPAPPGGGWVACMDWCRTNISDREFTSMGSGWIYVGEGVFEFRDPNDAMLFRLTWG